MSKFLPTLLFLVILITPAHFGNAACGDIISEYDYGDGNGPIEERSPIEDCDNPFGVTENPTSSLILKINDAEPVASYEVEEGTFPADFSFSVKFQLQNGGEASSNDVFSLLYRHEGEDYRDVTGFNADNDLVIQEPGTYTFVNKLFLTTPGPLSLQQKIREFFIPTAHAFSQGLSAETFATTFTIEEVPAAPEGASSVLFLPGSPASRLYTDGVASIENQLWEPNRDDDVAYLYLDSAGKSVHEDIYTKDVIDEVNVSPVLQKNIYKSFIKDLKRWKEDDNLIADYAVVPYDWRLSLDDLLRGGEELPGGHIYYSGIRGATSTPYIIQELRRLAAGSQTGRVTIVAHSNGGLLTKALTEKLGSEASDLIDQIILVAVPQVGTPQAIGALLHGHDQGIPADWLRLILSPVEARDFLKTAPVAYNLLPSAQYFTQGYSPVVTFDDSDLLATWREKYGDSLRNGEGLQTFIDDQSRAQLPVSDESIFPISGVEFLYNKAQTLHNTLDDWTPPSGVNLTEIAGWGVKTMSTIEYKEGRKTECSVPGDMYSCAVVPALEFGVKETLDGDGTVVAKSALWTEVSPGVEKYWVDLKSHGKSGFFGSTINRKHANILEVNELRELIQNIVSEADAPLPDFIFSATPTASSPEKYTRFILKSPLFPHIYDSLGNHTGISTTTGLLEENVPDSRYQTYGELTLIEAPASTSLQIVMNGYAEGSFTLEIEEVFDEVVIASTTFAAVPTSATTIVKIFIPAGGNIVNASVLSVDEDGDGISEIDLDPVVGGVVVPDFSAPPETIATAASTIGTKGDNGWYTSDVEVTFSATGTGSLNIQTFYSLNDNTEWMPYSSQSPLIISSEGRNRLRYYSEDTAGNREATSSLEINIDKTAPKASVSINPDTKELVIAGEDDNGVTEVVRDDRNYIVTDQAGHTTELIFSKLIQRSNLTYAKLKSIQYDGSPLTSLPDASFFYVWDKKSPHSLRSQIISVLGQSIGTAKFDKRKDRTTVFLKEKGQKQQRKKIPGLHILTWTIDKGVVTYNL